jgi:hypothetical protein
LSLLFFKPDKQGVTIRVDGGAAVKKIVLATSLLIASFSGAVQAQTYPDLGHALYARGYTGTVWVNSFDPMLQTTI